jgi:hypothetical protein
MRLHNSTMRVIRDSADRIHKNAQLTVNLSFLELTKSWPDKVEKVGKNTCHMARASTSKIALIWNGHWRECDELYENLNKDAEDQMSKYIKAFSSWHDCYHSQLGYVCFPRIFPGCQYHKTSVLFTDRSIRMKVSFVMHYQFWYECVILNCSISESVHEYCCRWFSLSSDLTWINWIL